MSQEAFNINEMDGWLEFCCEDVLFTVLKKVFMEKIMLSQRKKHLAMMEIFLVFGVVVKV